MIKEKNRIWLHQLNNLVEQNISNGHYNVPQLADDMAISERHLRRRLKQLTGLSPLTYIKKVRLQQARLFLEQKRYKTVAKTAAALGFQHPDTFTRTFLQYFGEKPSEYLN